MTIAARTALLNIGTNRQGSTCAPITPATVIRELIALRILGPAGGLTRRGSILRQDILDAQMDAMFA